jgi:hypothetical protein
MYHSASLCRLKIQNFAAMLCADDSRRLRVCMMHYFSTLKLDIVVPAALHADDDGAASTHVDIKTDPRCQIEGLDVKSMSTALVERYI